MPYRVARVPGDSRRLVIHPERGAGTHLLIGLGVASATLGGVMAMVSPIAGIAVAVASTAFSGWLGTEAYLTRIELLRDEREGRLLIHWRAVGKPRELAIALEDLRDVLVEKNASGLVRLVLRLHAGERVALTPYFATTAAVEEGAATVRELLGLQATSRQ